LLRRHDDTQQGRPGRRGAAEEVRAGIDDHFSRLRTVETNHRDVPLQILLSVGRFDPTRTDLHLRALEHADCTDANCRDEHHGHDHSATFSTWSYETNRPLSLEALRETARKLPGNIYRAVLQVVGRRVDITLENEWGDRTPRTQIVVVGAPWHGGWPGTAGEIRPLRSDDHEMTPVISNENQLYVAPDGPTDRRSCCDDDDHRIAISALHNSDPWWT
jgi:hypothetical protein